ncbi:MAG: regulatory protein RecX [Chloroflexi bacterium]|nr:regulatory protein RecX [Chloroflexota bacterium]
MTRTVTAVEKQGNGVVTVTVISDDEDGDAPQPALLPIESVILNQVRTGAEFSDARWEEIRADGALLLATRRGLELLSRKPRTERDLRTALGEAFQPEDIDRALARLHELGYLDDRAWSDRYVAAPRAQARGRSLLRSELKARGVPDEVVAEALEGRDELSTALETAAKRLRSLRSIEDEERRRRRLYDFLRRRGFSDDVCRRAMDSVLAGANR